MKEKTRKILGRLRDSIDYWMGAARVEFTDDLDRIMREEEITKSELANRMGTSQAYISKALGGQTNFTIQSLVKLARAVDAVLHIRLTRNNEVLYTRRVGAAPAIQPMGIMGSYGQVRQLQWNWKKGRTSEAMIITLVPDDPYDMPHLSAPEISAITEITGQHVQ